jgi:hypothetical protein
MISRMRLDVWRESGQVLEEPWEEVGVGERKRKDKITTRVYDFVSYTIK